MTSSSNSTMGVQLTPGQRCLLDLLQRKLLKTVYSYAKLKQQMVSCRGSQQNEEELLRLREKIKRISARQKRFTLEIINGNGNNTIPKESFFEALGLVTKEALSKLNSKTNERRRRTTANPRFSHEAIQAKRALEPPTKRLESRVTKDKRETSANNNNSNNNNNGKRNQRNQQHNNNSTSNNTNSSKVESSSKPNITNNTRGGGNTNNSSNNNNNINSNSSSKNNQQALGNSNGNLRSSNRSASSRQRNLISQSERQEAYNQYRNLQKQINSKMSIIERKQASIEKLHRDNQMIKKRYLDLIGSTEFSEVKHEGGLATATTCVENNVVDASNNNNNTNVDDVNQEDHQQVASQTETDHQHLNVQQPVDMWIDMKCDESLDGLD